MGIKLYVRFVCDNCLAKTFCFLHLIGELAMPNFFSAKYMFAMVAAKEYRKKLSKTFTFTQDFLPSEQNLLKNHLILWQQKLQRSTIRNKK